MIEIKYDESKNNLKLPKNIRQIGKPGDKTRIYIEDYVVTYINQMTRGSLEEQRLAVLLGKTGSNEGERLVFIDGAVEAENVIVQEDQVVFTSEVWSSLYEEIDRYFHNTEVVGWFITRPGKSLGINEKITKSHVDNFAGEDKTLLVSDPVDHDEVFYIYEQGRLIRQDGYYIYYERNEDMQNYMVDHREGESSESQVKDIFAVRREKKEGGGQPDSTDQQPGSVNKEEKAAGDSNNDKVVAFKNRKGIPKELSENMKRVSSLVITFGVLFALIMGFKQLNADQTQTVDNDSGVIPVEAVDGNITSSQAHGDAVKRESNALENDVQTENGCQLQQNAAAKNEAEDLKDTEDLKNTEDSANGNQAQAKNDQPIVITEGQDDEASGKNEENQDVPVQNVIRQYTVQNGDTLAGICQKLYSDYSYIELIQEMNQIEDPDKIYPGMTLNLP